MEPNSNIVALRNLLDEDARKFSCAEVVLKNHLENWIKQATSLSLKTVLHKYLDFVKAHSEKLQAFFEDESINFISVDNRVMTALIAETNEKLAACADAPITDVCLLACVQHINHYKISVYGTASSFAKALDLSAATLLFREMEINEKNIDHNLTDLAERDINIKAITPIVLTN